MQSDKEMHDRILSYLRNNKTTIDKIEHITAEVTHDFDPEGSRPIEIEFNEAFSSIKEELSLIFPSINNRDRTFAVAMFFQEIGRRVNPTHYNED